MSEVKVVSVSLVFENCESVSFKPVAIGQFEMDGFHKKIVRQAANAVSKCEFVDNVFLELYLNKGVLADLFNVSTISARLQCNDITQVHLIYEDGHEEVYFVDYKEGEHASDVLGAPNLCQEVYLNGDTAYICISEQHQIADYVDLDELECQKIRNMMSDRMPDVLFGLGVCMSGPVSGSNPDGVQTDAGSEDQVVSDDKLDDKLTRLAIIGALKDQLAGTQQMLNLVQGLVSQT